MMLTEKDTFAASIASDFTEEVLAADALLIEIAQANRRANYSELVYFQKHLNWDETAVKREVRRIGNVLRDRAIAGSPTDRPAAIAEAATAAKVLESEGPKVAEQIAKLESKLRSMESDARLSTKRCEDQSSAIERLRSMCPQHVADAVRHCRNILDQTLGREISDIGIRANELHCCLSRDRYSNDPRGTAAYMETVQRCRADAVSITITNGYRKLALSPQWASIRIELERELSELQAKLEPLQSQYDDELSKIEGPLDYYANGHHINK